MTEKDGAPAPSGRWSDLSTRIATAAVMACVGIVTIWPGGLWFVALVAIVVAVIVWELSVMVDAKPALLIAALAGACCLSLVALPPFPAILLAALPAVVAWRTVENNRAMYAIYTVFVILAGVGLVRLRIDFGVAWLIWLLLVVIATDVFGYFAGKAFGGPKFWPKISPKKTWSGTVAGWLASAFVGLGFYVLTDVGFWVVPFSIALSFASQMGDIAESAIKRRSGVKDSSRLLPGHGGFYDRFDGVLGASVFFQIMALVFSFAPPGV